MTHDDLLLVNCAQCGLEMLGETHRHLAKSVEMPAVRGRILGRPYCGSCLVVRRPPSAAATFDADAASPGQENAIRAMEDEAA